MRVFEKGTDRTAHVHVYVSGRVDALDEYGQYVDASDGAVCCYVAVKEGDEIRLDGRFNGVTLGIAYDCIVDGIYRKANSFTGKSVQMLKKRKLDVETVLYETSDGVIDTEMSVTSYRGKSRLRKDVPETIGTIELRVYITRQFDVEHVIENACMYDSDTEDEDSCLALSNYKDVPPQFRMSFDQNCLSLDGAKSKREKKKFLAKRPGKGPWAIFRFHYRSKDSIEGSKMELTFDATDETPAKQEAHPLELEYVPPLTIGSKPAGKNDGESSVRTSSPPPLDTPSTPMKASKKVPSFQAIFKKQQTDCQTSATSSASETKQNDIRDVAIGIATPNVYESTTYRAAAAGHDKKTNGTDSTTEKDDGCHENAMTSCEDPTDNVTRDADERKNNGVADVVPPKPSVEAPNALTDPCLVNVASVVEVAASILPSVTQIPTYPGSKDFVKSGGKGFTSPLKKAAVKPAPIDTVSSTVLQKHLVSLESPNPLKRASESALTSPLGPKRNKSEAAPSPPASARPPRNLTASPSLRIPSIEVQVAEQRRILEALRGKCAEMARKKAAQEQKLAPYKERMAKELERLKQETAEQEALAAAEEEAYMAGEAMLAEFESGVDELQAVD